MTLIEDPETGELVETDNLPEDSYKRRYLELHLRVQSSTIIDLETTDVLTFDEDDWEIDDTDSGVLVRRSEPTTYLGKKLQEHQNNQHE